MKRRIGLLATALTAVTALGLGAGEAAAVTPPDATAVQATTTTTSHWVRVFHDDFTQRARLGRFLAVYGAKWGAYPEPYRDTTGHGLYSTNRVLSVRYGKLRYWVHTEKGQPLVAAPYPSPGAGYLHVRYGKMEIRFRADAVPGYKMAWMLWPDSNHAADGEIDFPEGNFTTDVRGFSHCTGANHVVNCLNVHTGRSFQRWHTAVAIWTPGRVTFRLDGVRVGTTTRQVPWRSMHPVFQTETSIGSLLPPRTASGMVYMDYVTIWRYR
jgi:hypothetical protein